MSQVFTFQRVFLGLPHSESKCCGLIDAEAFSTSICEGRIYAGSVTADLTDPFIKRRAIFDPVQERNLRLAKMTEAVTNRTGVLSQVDWQGQNQMNCAIFSADSNRTRGFLVKILNKYLNMCVCVCKWNKIETMSYSDAQLFREPLTGNQWLQRSSSLATVKLSLGLVFLYHHNLLFKM